MPAGVARARLTADPGVRRVGRGGRLGWGGMMCGEQRPLVERVLTGGEGHGMLTEGLDS